MHQTGWAPSPVPSPASSEVPASLPRPTPTGAGLELTRAPRRRTWAADLNMNGLQQDRGALDFRPGSKEGEQNPKANFDGERLKKQSRLAVESPLPAGL